MTDRQKIKHAIGVFKTLSARYTDLCGKDQAAAAIIRNTDDLCELLEKPHETDSKVSKDVSPKANLLSAMLLGKICARKRNFRQPDMAKWASDMDKILRLDKRTPEELTEVIEWCQQDDFWADNILSPSKLRKQLDKLEMRMRKDKTWQRTQGLRRPVSTGKSAKDRYLEILDQTCPHCNKVGWKNCECPDPCI